MNNKETTSLYLVLVHQPVLNKRGETIGSAVTNLDIHDIARMARTYGVARYFISTPYRDQHILIRELLAHWIDGAGATYNPARKEALERVELAWDIDEVIHNISTEQGSAPLLIATSAKGQKKTIEYAEARAKIYAGERMLLVLGTAHGLAPEIMQKADYTLPPVSGGTCYNHLSVRSAASIIVDRLLGI